MITFMLGVLGSVIFWCIFIPVNFVIALLVLKNIFPDALNPFVTGNKIFSEYRDANGKTWAASISMIFTFMIFWPIILMAFILYKISGVFFPMFRNLLTKLINLIPVITIKKEE